MSRLKDMLTMKLPGWENAEVLHRPTKDWSIVRVQTPEDYKTETWFLGHCLGSKHFETFERGHRVFSLRDEHGIPHATILCLKPKFVSPYQFCADLGTIQEANIGGELMRCLQVRGRMDAAAAVPYLQIVRKWFIQCVGHDYEGIPTEAVDAHNLVFGDRDKTYHDDLMLDMDTVGNGWLDEEPEDPGIKQPWISL